MKPYNDLGIFLSAGMFRYAMGLCSDVPIVRISWNEDCDQLVFESEDGIRAFVSVVEEGYKNGSIAEMKDCVWYVLTSSLKKLANIIPVDTFFWENRKEALKCSLNGGGHLLEYSEAVDHYLVLCGSFYPQYLEFDLHAAVTDLASIHIETVDEEANAVDIVKLLHDGELASNPLTEESV